MTFGNLINLARLDQLTMAIGETNFGDMLAETAHSIGEADHVMIFAFIPRMPPRSVVSAGTIEASAAKAARLNYANSLYLLDPNYPAIRTHKTTSARWFETQHYCDGFRNEFLDRAAVSDVLAFVVNQDEVSYYVLLLRTEGRSFANAHRWLFSQVGELIAASVRKHFSYMHAFKGQNQFMIGRVLSDSPAFAAITPRERLVCIGILTGHTSESIALNLTISINSVLTYRKRLYEKLDISSQNELFVRVIAAMMLLGENATDPGAAKQILKNAADPYGANVGSVAHDAYLGEAFLA